MQTYLEINLPYTISQIHFNGLSGELFSLFNTHGDFYTTKVEEVSSGSTEKTPTFQRVIDGVRVTVHSTGETPLPSDQELRTFLSQSLHSALQTQ